MPNCSKTCIPQLLVSCNSRLMCGFSLANLISYISSKRIVLTGLLSSHTAKSLIAGYALMPFLSAHDFRLRRRRWPAIEKGKGCWIFATDKRRRVFLVQEKEKKVMAQRNRKLKV